MKRHALPCTFSCLGAFWAGHKDSFAEEVAFPRPSYRRGQSRTVPFPDLLSRWWCVQRVSVCCFVSWTVSGVSIVCFRLYTYCFLWTSHADGIWELLFSLKKFFLAALGLCCCMGFSLVVGSEDNSRCSSQALHCSGFSCDGARALGHVGFSGCGARS